MTGTDLCVNKPQSVPVIFEPPCTNLILVWAFKMNLFYFLTYVAYICESTVIIMKKLIMRF
jgi:hypothetical protein